MEKILSIPVLKMEIIHLATKKIVTNFRLSCFGGRTIVAERLDEPPVILSDKSLEDGLQWLMQNMEESLNVKIEDNYFSIMATIK